MKSLGFCLFRQEKSLEKISDFNDSMSCGTHLAIHVPCQHLHFLTLFFLLFKINLGQFILTNISISVGILKVLFVF